VLLSRWNGCATRSLNGTGRDVDEGYIDKFIETVNDDLNMPRAMALTWELVKSDLPASTKKATILFFDQVLGLRLGEWQPKEEVLPEEILAFGPATPAGTPGETLERFGCVARPGDAAGYEIEDTPRDRG